MPCCFGLTAERNEFCEQTSAAPGAKEADEEPCFSPRNSASCTGAANTEKQQRPTSRAGEAAPSHEASDERRADEKVRQDSLQHFSVFDFAAEL